MEPIEKILGNKKGNTETTVFEREGDSGRELVKLTYVNHKLIDVKIDRIL